MSKDFQLEIISPEKKIFSGKAASVIAPGVIGRFGVYPGHAMMVTPLQAGAIVYTVGGEEKTLEVRGGIVEVNHNLVTICVE
mgnify:CR=1 FL=1